MNAGKNKVTAVKTGSFAIFENLLLLILVSTAPTNLNIDGIQSRGFKIRFNRPDNVNGILAAYKILISEGRNCIQQILVHGKCSICMVKKKPAATESLNLSIWSDLKNSHKHDLQNIVRCLQDSCSKYISPQTILCL